MWRSCIAAGHKAVQHADPALFSGLLVLDEFGRDTEAVLSREDVVDLRALGARAIGDGDKRPVGLVGARSCARYMDPVAGGFDLGGEVGVVSESGDHLGPAGELVTCGACDVRPRQGTDSSQHVGAAVGLAVVL